MSDTKPTLWVVEFDERRHAEQGYHAFSWGDMRHALLADLAAGLLEQIKCDTCGGSGRLTYQDWRNSDPDWTECPDCVGGYRVPKAAETAAHYTVGGTRIDSMLVELVVVDWLEEMRAEKEDTGG